MQELKNHGCIHILPGSCHNPHIAPLGMEVAGPSYVGDRRADSMASMDDTHTESINRGTTERRGRQNINKSASFLLEHNEKIQV